MSPVSLGAVQPCRGGGSWHQLSPPCHAGSALALVAARTLFLLGASALF